MPALALAPFTPWIATAGFGWLYYRRIRRQFGRQVYRPKRALLRLCVLTLVSCALLFAAVMWPRLVPGLAIGAAAGVGLGWLALRHTRIARIDGLREYTPNPWIGGVLSVLLIGRLAWRWHDGAFAAGAQPLGEQASPLTFGFLATLVAYYLVSGFGLASRMRALAIDAAPIAAPASNSRKPHS